MVAALILDSEKFKLEADHECSKAYPTASLQHYAIKERPVNLTPVGKTFNLLKQAFDLLTMNEIKLLIKILAKL